MIRKTILMAVLFFLTIMFYPFFFLFAGAEELKSAGKTGKIIVIDPAHGGRDSGILIDGKTSEKDFDLRTALKISELSTGSGFTPVLVRDKEMDLSPSDRKTFANIKSPVAYVGIHAGVSYGSKGRSVRIYIWSENMGVLSLGRQKLLRTIGAETDIADEKDPKLKLSGDAQNDYNAASRRIAFLIKAEIEKNIQDIPCSIEKAPVSGLHGLNMPAVSVEILQPSNTEDFITGIASSISKALENFISGKNLPDEE